MLSLGFRAMRVRCFGGKGCGAILIVQAFWVAAFLPSQGAWLHLETLFCGACYWYPTDVDHAVEKNPCSRCSLALMSGVSKLRNPEQSRECQGWVELTNRTPWRPPLREAGEIPTLPSLGL